MASFPTTVKTFTTRNAGDTIQPAHVNDLQDEVNAIEATMLNNGGFTMKANAITFPAVQAASADANTLDDYEEGTFTPTIASTGGGTPTYTTQLGSYVKVGQQVTVWAWVELASKGTLGAGTVQLASLPFQAATSPALSYPATVGVFGAMTTSVVMLSAMVAGSNTYMDFRHLTAAGTSMSTTLVADVSNTWLVVVTATYRTTA